MIFFLIPSGNIFLLFILQNKNEKYELPCIFYLLYSREIFSYFNCFNPISVCIKQLHEKDVIITLYMENVFIK